MPALPRIANLCAGALLALCSCAASSTDKAGHPPLEAVPAVDLSRYLGTWYEISSFPQSFQRGCHGTTATYALRKDGKISVTNRCRKGSLDGKLKVAKGLARVSDTATNAKLKVSFFRPFWGDYWVIDLADDYRYAVVGHPGRDYLWILSRTPQMDAGTYDAILQRLEAQQYETGRLVNTAQPAAPAPAAKL